MLPDRIRGRSNGLSAAGEEAQRGGRERAGARGTLIARALFEVRVAVRVARLDFEEVWNVVDVHLLINRGRRRVGRLAKQLPRPKSDDGKG